MVMLGAYKMTKHAAERAVDMAVTADEIMRAITTPELTYQQQDRPGQHIRAAGRIALAMQGEKIVTVLHRTVDAYRRDDVAFDVQRARLAP